MNKVKILIQISAIPTSEPNQKDTKKNTHLPKVRRSQPFNLPSRIHGLIKPVLNNTTWRSCNANQSQFNAFLMSLETGFPTTPAGCWKMFRGGCVGIIRKKLGGWGHAKMIWNIYVWRILKNTCCFLLKKKHDPKKTRWFSKSPWLSQWHAMMHWSGTHDRWSPRKFEKGTSAVSQISKPSTVSIYFH